MIFLVRAAAVARRKRDAWGDEDGRQDTQCRPARRGGRRSALACRRNLQDVGTSDSVDERTVAQGHGHIVGFREMTMYEAAIDIVIAHGDDAVPPSRAATGMADVLSENTSGIRTAVFTSWPPRMDAKSVEGRAQSGRNSAATWDGAS